MQAMLQKAGVKTVFKTIYPAETTDLTPIVAKAIAPKPDLIVGGTQSEDAYAQVKAMVQAKFSPKFLFFANGANSPTEFPSQGRQGERQRHLQLLRLDADSVPTSGNKLFVAQYLKRYGGTPFDIDNNSAEAWAVGQLLQLVAKKTGTIDNKTIIKALHAGTWSTIEGNLSWNAYGEPSGGDLLVEWVNGRLLPVYPKSVALHAPTYPKPAWGAK